MCAGGREGDRAPSLTWVSGSWFTTLYSAAKHKHSGPSTAGATSVPVSPSSVGASLHVRAANSPCSHSQQFRTADSSSCSPHLRFRTANSPSCSPHLRLRTAAAKSRAKMSSEAPRSIWYTLTVRCRRPMFMRAVATRSSAVGTIRTVAFRRPARGPGTATDTVCKQERRQAARGSRLRCNSTK